MLSILSVLSETFLAFNLLVTLKRNSNIHSQLPVRIEYIQPSRFVRGLGGYFHM